ncbi:hypothetical protein CN080_26620 [Sinorhizobium meliloti]|nr:hypothetical protein CN080_26620 [Sinorhizobium meliloti]
MSDALDALPSMIERIRHDLVGLKVPRALEALDHLVRRLETEAERGFTRACFMRLIAHRRSPAPGKQSSWKH